MIGAAPFDYQESSPSRAVLSAARTLVRLNSPIELGRPLCVERWQTGQGGGRCFEPNRRCREWEGNCGPSSRKSRQGRLKGCSATQRHHAPKISTTRLLMRTAEADAYSGYNELSDVRRAPGPIAPALCWQTRRQFFELGYRGQCPARQKGHGDLADRTGGSQAYRRLV
jgi:hypothetical protein